MPRDLDLRRPQPPHGRHPHKVIFVIGLGILFVVALVVFYPLLFGQAPSSPTRATASVNSRMVKESDAFKRMKATFLGENVTPPAATSIPPMPPSQGDDCNDECKRLRDENSKLRLALQQVPKPAGPTPPNTDAARKAEAAEAERKKRQEQDRKLVSWGMPKKDEEARKLLKVNKPLSPFSLAPGWLIPCMTEGKVSNETPGAFRIRVRQPVYDSATSTYVVIPQESLIVATPRGGALFNDTRMGITINTLTFPDASWAKLPKSTAGDREGVAGFSDQIDRRWGSLFASILLTGVLRAGTSVVAGGSYAEDPMERVAGSVAMEGARQGERQVRQYLRTDPIIWERPGYQCVILLEEEFALAKAWKGIP